MKTQIKKQYKMIVVKVDFTKDYSMVFGPFTSRLKAKIWANKYKKEVGMYWS